MATDTKYKCADKFADVNIMTVSVYGRLSFFDRVCDGFKPTNEMSFNEIYKLWKDVDFFKELRELGFVSVSYNNGEFTDFEPSENGGNRHQALALSCFLSSKFADSSAKVSSPHERGLLFIAIFERIGPFEIKYTNEQGTIVIFHFNYNRDSQF